MVLRLWSAVWQLPDDVDVGAYGPGDKGCSNGGVAVDTTPYDSAFTCDCSDSRFTGKYKIIATPKGQSNPLFWLYP